MPPLSAQEIRAIRDEAGYTRRELAHELGYSIESVKDWERTDKKRRPMPREVEARFLTLCNPRRAAYMTLRTQALAPAA